MVLSDLSKAFDRCNRDLIIYKVKNINITGSKVQIVFNNKHSKRIVIDDGLPQGHNETGPRTCKK